MNHPVHWLSSPVVCQSTTWLTASWFIGKLSGYCHDYPKHCKPQTLLSNRLWTSMNTANCVIRSICDCNWVQLMQIIFCRDMCIFLCHKTRWQRDFRTGKWQKQKCQGMEFAGLKMTDKKSAAVQNWKTNCCWVAFWITLYANENCRITLDQGFPASFWPDTPPSIL